MADEINNEQEVQKKQVMLEKIAKKLEEYDQLFKNDGITDSPEQQKIQSLKEEIQQALEKLSSVVSGDPVQHGGEENIDGEVPSGDNFAGAKEIDVTKVKMITKLFAEGSVDEYGDGISHDDVDQNWIGDCYFLSALAAVAKADPSAIEKLIDGPKSDGSYDVTLYEKGGFLYMSNNPTVINVHPRTLEKDGRTTVGLGDGELWVLLVERAFAEMNGGYDEIEGGHADDALEVITGQDATTKRLSSMNNTELVEFVQGHLDAKTPLTTSSISADDGSKKAIAAGNSNVVLGHAYYIISISSSAITIRNPHNNTLPGGREVTLSFDDYRKFYYKISYLE
ncbi:MAG: C2 family cysteine protease [Aureispira sp.]